MKSYEQTEVNRLVQLCREHDDDAFCELLDRYTPMLWKVVSGFSGSGISDPELFHEASVALHSAALKYDLAQSSVTFGLFARICVHNRMIDLMRTMKPRVSDIDTVYAVDTDEECIETELVTRETFDSVIERAKSILSEYEYKVLILHIQGYQTAAIAKALSRTPKSVDNAKFRLFRLLREKLGGISD